MPLTAFFNRLLAGEQAPCGFPPLDQALVESEGLLCGSDYFVPELILEALANGIFPWNPWLRVFGDEDKSAVLKAGMEEDTDAILASLPECLRDAKWNGHDQTDLPSIARNGEPVMWWAPPMRAIFDLDELHIPRRLLRTMKSGKFEVTYDEAFPEVMLACANVDDRRNEPWISREFFACCVKLFELGCAHSVECWTRNESGERRLAGGVYGVAVNGLFDAESMFSVERDASKVALFSLLLRLKEHGFKLFDVQVLNDHTERLGARDIPRDEYMIRLQEAVRTKCVF